MAENTTTATRAGPERADQDALGVRERAADERERLADERQRLADERESQADVRDRWADEREALADERERDADLREAGQTQRQLKLDERDQHLRSAFRDLNGRMLEAIANSRELLALSEQRLDREEAAVGRDQSRRERHQAEINREAAHGERALAAQLPDSSQLTARSKALFKQARTALEVLAASEEDVARLHEQWAARIPGRRDSMLDIAAKAHAAARRAREILRGFEQ